MVKKLNWGVLIFVLLLSCRQNNEDSNANVKDSSRDTQDQTNTNSTDTSTDDTDTNQSCEQDYEGHDACRQLYGDMYYCGPSGECIEASGCEAMSCCLPGAQGDNWCQNNFGECSECVAGESDGLCSPLECPD